jgi:hypothetical protein
MATSLHLLRADSSSLAAPVIAALIREAGARVVVVLLDAMPLSGLPPEVAVRRLAPDDLDYSGLLDLIFAADRVVAW